VIIGGNVYVIVSLVFEPYRRFPFVSSIYFTTITDGALITAWIIATGFMQSPFYLIWYVSLIAVAFRFTPKETIISTFVYLILYLFVFVVDSGIHTPFSDLITRVGFIPIAGMLGMYFSIELAEQIDGKVKIIRGEQALQKAKNQLEAKVEERTEDLISINKDITDSIKYAERIQTAIMPTAEEFKAVFPDSFILYRPKDIISGDFYWLHHQGDCSYFAVVDCTGHGVPGAMMSMIGNNLLNRAFLDKGIVDPAKALADMDSTLGNMLKNDSEGIAVNDGMDLMLCVIDHKKSEVRYEGAGGYGFIISQKGELREMITTRFSIGGLLTSEEKNFATRIIEYEKGDIMYLFSDGFQDQFGGPRGKKYYRKSLMALIQSEHDQPMVNQKNTLEKSLLDWMGHLTQIDDISVIGIRF
jgi:serine phosphatase RsbU (regulator of sigma subunit)